MATRKRAPDRCRSTPHPARHEARRHTAIRVHLSPKASRHVSEVTFEAVRSRTHSAQYSGEGGSQAWLGGCEGERPDSEI